jgi:8-oxo-dGTP diphosphatase
MKAYNCIIILNKNKDRLLFCKRANDPYQGLFNFVGGKIEEGEPPLEAAYRELEEETGITREDTKLLPFMDYVWYLQDIRMEVYVGVLKRQVCLRQEKHPLFWLDFSCNFFDMKTFAGEGNIGHMIEILKMSEI